jgi:hypothetical protein
VNGAFTDEAVTIDGGPGNDSLLGGDGAEVFLGGRGDDFVDGNRGDDTAFLGEDDDTFHWDPGDANDTIEGQDGLDTLDFNGANIAERIDISANGGRVRFSRDIANVTMDLDDVEGIVFHAFGGVDLVTVNDLAGTDVEKVDADLAAQAGGADAAADSVIVNGTLGPDAAAVSLVDDKPVVSGLPATVTVSGGEAVNDTLQLNGESGNDVVTVHGSITGLASLGVDGGADLDSTHVDGTKAADTIQVVPNGTWQPSSDRPPPARSSTRPPNRSWCPAWAGWTRSSAQSGWRRSPRS